jgi:site-specific DNA-methyltransferase (adenine-specific)
MNVIYENDNGKIIHGDNLEIMKTLEEQSIDSCISDFPYFVKFMNKKWDSKLKLEIYNWCYPRAIELLRIIKNGGYVCIFGHHKTNHHLKTAFEDAGFNIVDEIDWIYLCVSEDTEILTQDGWKSYTTLTKEDKAMTYNIENNLLEWNDINDKYVYKYNGKMKSIKNRNTDQLITPNHKILYKSYLKNMANLKRYYYISDWKYTKAKDIKPHGGIKLPLAGKYLGTIEVGTDLAWLIGIILSEGYYHKNCEAISIYQNSVNINIVNKIRDKLNSTNIKFSEYVRTYKYEDKYMSLSKLNPKGLEKMKLKYKNKTYDQHQFYIGVNEIIKIKKYIPKKILTLDLLEWIYNDRLSLLEGLIDGDGSKRIINNDKHSYEILQFYQKDLQFRINFQLLCFSLGLRTSWNEKKYAIGISKNSFTQIQSKYFVNNADNKKELPEIDYDGIIWCISTRNNNFVARRNNKIFITGNSGFPKNQDIGKLFDKAEGVTREVIGVDTTKQRPNAKDNRSKENAVGKFGIMGNGGVITKPQSDMAKRWDGWKTNGLKPAKEIITIFQKPLDGTYINNITKHGCGAMNIDACRVSMTTNDIDIINAKSSKNPTTNYSDKNDKIYGKYALDKASPANPEGRFPPNVLLSEEMGQELDLQTGITKSSGGQTNSCYRPESQIYRTGEDNKKKENGGKGDIGGGSRIFPIFKYCPKVSPTERKLPNGERNPHVTVKPIALIKWLIKLITPLEGKTIDITSGSCTHAVCCEELNQNEGYNLKWINIELMNTEEENYCEIGKQRLEGLINN